MNRLTWLVAMVATITGPGHAAERGGHADPRVTRVVTDVWGIVYDSIGRGPLRGASVQAVGLEDSVAGRIFRARTDSTGRFRLGEIPPGEYAVGFSHPRIDSLGLELSARAVRLHGAVQRVELATPSSRTVAAAVCPEGTYGDSVGVLLGRALSPGTRMPLPGVTVTATWTETVIARNSIQQRDPEVAATSDAGGWFGMCALPAAVPLMVRAGLGPDSSGYVVIEMLPGELRAATFMVGEATRVEVFASDTGAGASPLDSAFVWQWHGAAQLRGTVVDDRGEPVAGARVGIWSSGRHATTTARGAFSIDSAPGGTHTLEVRALGYVPVQRPVHLSTDAETVADISLGEKTTALPTVTVRGSLVYSKNLSAFEERRLTSPFGEFFTPEMLEKLPKLPLSSVMMQATGVWVTGRNRRIFMKRGGSFCMPTFYVDGLRTYMDSEEMDLWFRSDDLAGIEVYPRTSLVPNEYAGLLTGCGVIALWTRTPGVKLKKE